MRWSVVLPTRSFYLGPGPSGGRRLGSAPGVGFDFETTSDQIDSAMPEKRILGAQYGSLQPWIRSGEKGIVANSPERERHPPAYRPVVRRVSRYRANFAFAPLPPYRGHADLHQMGSSCL